MTDINFDSRSFCKSHGCEGLGLADVVAPKIPRLLPLDPNQPTTAQGCALRIMKDFSLDPIRVEELSRKDAGLEVKPSADGTWCRANGTELTLRPDTPQHVLFNKTQGTYTLYKTLDRAALAFAQCALAVQDAMVTYPRSPEKPGPTPFMLVGAKEFAAVFDARLPQADVEILLAEAR